MAKFKTKTPKVFSASLRLWPSNPVDFVYEFDTRNTRLNNEKHNIHFQRCSECGALNNKVLCTFCNLRLKDFYTANN